MELEQINARMASDMELRDFSPKTKENYRRYAGKYLEWLDCPVEEAGEEEIRAYLKELLEHGLTTGTVNMYNAAITFLYEVTLNRPLNRKQVPRLKEHRKLPEALSKEELGRIFAHAPNLRNKAMLMTIYGGGLRVSEACRLRVKDIDSVGMRIFVHEGKGKKERYTLLSQANLEVLREYWKQYRPNHPDGWLFLGHTREGPIGESGVQQALRIAKERAGIDRYATVHTLRSSFATHLLESGVDFFTVKRLLGHVSMQTTTRYLRVVGFAPSLKSPLDSLPEISGHA